MPFQKGNTYGKKAAAEPAAKKVEPNIPATPAKEQLEEVAKNPEPVCFLKIPKGAIDWRDANVTWKDKNWSAIYKDVTEQGYRLHSSSITGPDILLTFVK